MSFFCLIPDCFTKNNLDNLFNMMLKPIKQKRKLARLSWHDYSIKMKYNDINKNSVNFLNSTATLVDKMSLLEGKPNQSFQRHYWRKNEASDFLNFKAPRSRQKLKENLRLLLASEDISLNEDKINHVEPKKEKKEKKKNQSKTSLNSYPLHKKLMKSTSASSFIDNANSSLYRTKFFPSPGKNKEEKLNKNTSLFLNYTKHTKKIKLYRPRLCKIEESIRHHVNMSMTNLNWFKKEYG